MADVIYDVPLIAQPNKLACWAASMAMLVNFRRQASFAPNDLARSVGRDLRSSYGWDMLEAVKDDFGFVDIELPSNMSLYPLPGQWSSWLTENGPLWITTIGAPSHAIVVRGITGDLTVDGTSLLINNPWDTTADFSEDPIDFDPPNAGIAYQQGFADLASDFGNMVLSDYGSWRVLHLSR
jgi:hypothetical protein